MSTIHDLRDQVLELTPESQFELFLELYRRFGSPTGTHSQGVSSIVKEPGVCGGSACIVRTRIPVWVLAQLKSWGKTDAEILTAYPTLTAADLVNAWTYAAEHRDEIDTDIKENEEA